MLRSVGEFCSAWRVVIPRQFGFRLGKELMIVFIITQMQKSRAAELRL